MSIIEGYIIIMLGLSKTVIYWEFFVILITLSVCLDYQDRGLYYSDSDSICCTPNMDDLDVQIDVEGKDRKFVKSWGGTSCDSTIGSCAGRIFPAQSWLIVEQGVEPFQYKTLIPMIQEVKKVTDIFGRLKLMTVRARVKENSIHQTKIDYEPHRCVVFGDGLVHHFTDGNTQSKIILKCISLKRPIKQINDFTE